MDASVSEWLWWSILETSSDLSKIPAFMKYCKEQIIMQRDDPHIIELEGLEMQKMDSQWIELKE